MTGIKSLTCERTGGRDVLRCWCGHYEDQHDPGLNYCLAKGSRDVPSCTCKQFKVRGNAPEGTDIYRKDETSYPDGYHVTEIPRGTFGEASKIEEELAEFKDALAQKCSVMAILELADLIGAIEGWLDRYHPSIELGDLLAMTAITKRAFKSGHRQPKEE
jgi:hypothetical protein